MSLARMSFASFAVIMPLMFMGVAATEADTEHRDHGCLESSYRSCLQDGRFEVPLPS